MCLFSSLSPPAAALSAACGTNNYTFSLPSSPKKLNISTEKQKSRHCRENVRKFGREQTMECRDTSTRTCTSTSADTHLKTMRVLDVQLVLLVAFGSWLLASPYNLGNKLQVKQGSCSQLHLFDGMMQKLIGDLTFVPLEYKPPREFTDVVLWLPFEE